MITGERDIKWSKVSTFELAKLHYDKLCIYNVILRATTKKVYNRMHSKITINKSKWNSKNWSGNSQEGKKKKTEKQKNIQQTKMKMAD